MGNAITKVSIRGFRSIRRLENFELRSLNVLIGANGSGKSNFAYFFHFILRMRWGELALEVKVKGGADRQLYLGPTVTTQIEGKISFAAFRWEFELVPTANNELIVSNERLYQPVGDIIPQHQLARGAAEAHLGQIPWGEEGYPASSDADSLMIPEICVYHFSWTGDLALMRRSTSIRHSLRLTADAQNVAAIIQDMRKRHQAEYMRLRDIVRLVAPFFDDFVLSTKSAGEDIVTWLDWKQRGSNYPFLPSQLSDGTLRFICLATALLQPYPPQLIVIDEPELGLHPHALGVLAALIKSAATKSQIIVTTQSAMLLDEFDPADVIVAERKDEATEFTRLNKANLQAWLEDYSLGELWRKNFLPGGEI